eukprot:CAMPEP_0201283948 /NCGR_PEP_ID=MMETSP1317-20130820/55811_1 /ASSEMBLY_ACC=CAM_ASM_000770 /TAXON_ID=187299 /ORGANISM="Undescribed Undescribed, Strain Undescribed" /LENGTH=113 /DNA_ID=CAMNT_0047602065 /DNA_START=66 /DNA_END=408 /DNA_ORIENTATION=-
MRDARTRRHRAARTVRGLQLPHGPEVVQEVLLPGDQPGGLHGSPAELWVGAVPVDAAQPALLYISPAMLLAIAGTSYRQGEFQVLWQGFKTDTVPDEVEFLEFANFSEEYKKA